VFFFEIFQYLQLHAPSDVADNVTSQSFSFDILLGESWSLHACIMCAHA
jgi:hypothetical protein